MAITRSQSAQLGQNNEEGNSSTSTEATSRQEEVLEEEPSNEPERVAVEDADKLRGGMEGLEGTNQQPASEIGMPELPCPWNPLQKYLVFPPAKSLRERDWPKISYEDHAPEPRWRICADQKDPLKSGKDHTEDLIKKATGKWEIKGVRPKDNPQYNAQVHKPPLSYDHTVGLGALRWTFDEGDKRSWNGLSRDQLHEYAFRCLLETTRNPIYGRQIASDILNGQYRDGVKHAASPVPPLPSIPKEGHFTGLDKIEIGKATQRMEHQTWHWSKQYQRDSLAIRPGRMPEELHPLTRRMFEFRKRQIVTAKNPDEYGDTSSESDSDDTPLARKFSSPRKLDQKMPEAIQLGHRVPPSSFSGDGAYEFPAPMDIENDQEIETSRDVENPQKSDDPKNDDPMETENSVNLEEHADLVEAGESWVESSMPALESTTISRRLSPPAEPVDATESNVGNEGSAPEKDQSNIPAHLAWAGSELPRNTRRKARSQLSRSSTMKRPLGSLEIAPFGAKSSQTKNRDLTISGRVKKPEKSEARRSSRKE